MANITAPSRREAIAPPQYPGTTDPELTIDLETSKDSDSDAETFVPHVAVQVSYQQNAVSVPADFLTTDPPDLQPIILTPVDWPKTKVPEYEGCYAVVLDNVISPSECATLLQLAEASVPKSRLGKKGTHFWKPALVNVGSGYEVLKPDYRNSDRIIWDEQAVVDRLWERCARAPGLRERLATVEDEITILGPARKGKDAKRRWEFRRLNNRMRFLRYGKGQFFRSHCDGAYREPGDKIMQTLFTVHLYLNDSKATVGDGAELVGGATSFLSMDDVRKEDVDPKAGRVLIFQHRRLNHSGDDVLAGLKYTMRTDILYEKVSAV